MKSFLWSKVIEKAWDPEALKRMQLDFSRFEGEEGFLRRHAPSMPLWEEWWAFKQMEKLLDFRIIHIYDPLYPDILKEGIDPPPAFYYRGNPELLKRPLAAVVGSRRASAKELRLAGRLGRTFEAKGIAGVSGGALGIDGAFQSACPESVAVLGCGIDRIYPRAHEDLFRLLLKRGGLLSEFPLGAPPVGAHFPRRNRIIASLGSFLAVISAGKRSGALITLDFALDLGRDVYLGRELLESGLAGGFSLEELEACLKALPDAADRG